MSIKLNPQNKRCYFSNVSDLEAKNNNALAKGIRTYGKMGWFFSLLGLAFRVKDIGWVSTKSAARYFCALSKTALKISVESSAKKTSDVFTAKICHIAIIGGPGTGKTTTVNALKQRGERTEEEVATKLIEKALSEGHDNPSSGKDFDLLVAKGKAEQIKSYESAPKSEEKERVFHDRGPLDPLVYAAVHGFEVSSELNSQVTENDNQFSKIAFFLEKLPVYENTEVRSETEENAAVLGEKIIEFYKKREYKVIRVPPSSVEERVEMIVRESDSFFNKSP